MNNSFVKLFTIAFLLFFTYNIVKSQNYNEFFYSNQKNQDSSRFSFVFDNNNFFKNNEYFNKFVEGYTLIGFNLKPQIVFQANRHLNFNLGFNYLYYFGEHKFGQIAPVLRVQYKPIEKLSIIFGDIKGFTNHRLTEQVYNNEALFTQKSENGIQVLYESNRFFSDTWLEWRDFIWYDSPTQESFILASSNLLSLLYTENHKINLKLIVLGSHLGGQINANDDHIETILNSVSGLEYEVKIHSKALEKILISSLYHTSSDLSPTKQKKYKQGYGILSYIELSNKWVDLKLEHWYCEYYFSKFGNPIFESLSRFRAGYNEDRRAYLNAHLFWHKEFFKYIDMGAGGSLYSDLYNFKIDYSFGFYIKSNLNFQIGKRKH